MAKRSIPARPKSAADGSQEAPEARIIAVSLVHTNVTYTVGADEDGEYTYNVNVGQPVALDGSAYVYTCTIEIMKNKAESGEVTAGFNARYICGFRHERADDAQLIAKRLSSTTIWGMFTSLFAVVAQQIGVDFPSLPGHPRHITVDD